MLKKILLLMAVLAIAIIAVPIGYAIIDRQVKYKVSTEGIEVPEYSMLVIDFLHKHDNSTSLPFTAGAVIDIDNDGVEELFLGGGKGQSDGLFRYNNNQFENITSKAKLEKKKSEATLSSVVLDIDSNPTTQYIHIGID
jgi:hypothetical protein